LILTKTLFVVRNNLMCMFGRNVLWQYCCTLYPQIQSNIYCIEEKVDTKERERNIYVSVNNDDCHFNTNIPSSVLFISPIYVVGYSTLNTNVQYINDMQMMRETERNRRNPFIVSLLIYIYICTHIVIRKKETERQLTFFSELDYWSSIIINISLYLKTNAFDLSSHKNSYDRLKRLYLLNNNTSTKMMYDCFILRNKRA